VSYQQAGLVSGLGLSDLELAHLICWLFPFRRWGRCGCRRCLAGAYDLESTGEREMLLGQWHCGGRMQ